MDVEPELGLHVAALARALGWRRGLRFRLQELDFPRVAEFPALNHQYTALMQLRGLRDAELSLNANARDANFMLLERIPVLLWLLGAALERDPQLSADVACFPG